MKWWRRGVSAPRRGAIDSLRYHAQFDSRFERQLAVELLQAAMDLQSRGRYGESLEPLTEMVTILGSPPEENAPQPDKLLMTALTSLGSAFLQLDRPLEAEAPLRQAVDIGESLLGEIEPDRTAAAVMANGLVRLARCRELADDRQAAVRLVEQALPLLTRWNADQSVSNHPVRIASILAGANTMLVRLRAGQPE